MNRIKVRSSVDEMEEDILGFDLNEPILFSKQPTKKTKPVLQHPLSPTSDIHQNLLINSPIVRPTTTSHPNRPLFSTKTLDLSESPKRIQSPPGSKVRKMTATPESAHKKQKDSEATVSSELFYSDLLEYIVFILVRIQAVKRLENTMNKRKKQQRDYNTKYSELAEKIIKRTNELLIEYVICQYFINKNRK